MRFVKETIIILIILGIVIMLEILTSKTLEKSLSWLEKDMEYIENNIDKNEINEKVQEIKDKWKKDNEKLALFVEHNELEKISNNIIKIESNIKNRDKLETLEKVAEVKFMIEHISDKNKLKLRNIF